MKPCYPLTLDALIEGYKQHQRRARGLRECTLRNHERHARGFVRATFGDDPINLQRVSGAEVAGFAWLDATREAIDRCLRSHPDVRIEVRVIPPEVLDADRMERKTKINDIEVKLFRDIALALQPDRLYVDAPGDPGQLGRAVAEGLSGDIKIVSENKADSTYPVVGAASIVAKVARDAAFAELKRRLEPILGMPLGSDYGDSRTTRFLKAWLAKFGDLPPGTRRSWKPALALLSKTT